MTPQDQTRSTDGPEEARTASRSARLAASVAAEFTAASMRRRLTQSASAARRGAQALGAIRRRTPFPPRIEQIFREEAEQGLSRQFLGRRIAIGAAAILATAFEEFPGMLWFYAILAAFYGLGRWHEALVRRGRTRAELSHFFSTLDIALLVVALNMPNPLATTHYPPQMELRFDNFVYLFLPIISPIFTFQPRLILWNGVTAAVFWMAAVLIMAALPDSVSRLPADGDWGAPGSPVLSPTFVHWQGALHDCILLVVVAVLLAFAVARMRRLVWRQAELERDRSNLARFLPPAMVDRLAAQDHALGAVRESAAAVLFVDVIGFTSWAEARPPAEVIGTLREILQRLEGHVFEHGGAVDKYTGDGLLATFGAFDQADRPATQALATIQVILDDFAAWNTEREARGEDPILLALGLHYGPVVIGDIGSNRRLELTVIGDSVNVSNRLETLTRQIGRPAAVSQSVVDAVQAEAGRNESAEDAFGERLLALLEPAGDHALRGRREPVRVWAYRPDGKGSVG